jgi:tyrosine decarboxylase/aspartate 1-decarboxylase
VFRTLGVEGYTRIVGDCMKNTQALVRGLEKAGFKLICPPQLNIVAFKSENAKQVADNLRKKGWLISYIPRYDCIRVVVMPHVKRKHIAAFLADLAT